MKYDTNDPIYQPYSCYAMLVCMLLIHDLPCRTSLGLRHENKFVFSGA